MSSFLQKIVKSELMHDFLKDKQAWEHAIALYQGPDPLEHWYNYVCWYETYGNGDPENKFTETLERCLTIFEHNDYYKQDMRMLRLWLKYIDIQPNPLHFYQALYTRGVARQNALFYISWGAVFESLQAFKEAESVYNLGFQEKAQPYAELQHALVKIMYARAALQQQQQAQQQQQQQQQHKVVEEQQVSYQNNSNNIHGHIQQQSEQQAYQRAQQLAYAQQQQQLQQTQVINLNAEEEYAVQQQQQSNYQTVYMQQHMLEQQQQQQHYHNSQTHILHHTHQNLHIHQNTTSNHYHENQQQTHQAHYVINEVIQQPQQQHHQQQQQQVVENTTMSNGVIKSVAEEEEQQQRYNQQISHEEQLTYVEEQEQNVIVQQHDVQDVLDLTENNLNIEIEGIKLPKRFVNCARNNHELWKPALCLEEAPDENRKCHYNKDKVYPPGAGYEISPEELRAKKYLKIANSTQEEKQVINNRQSADYDIGSSSDKEDVYGFSEHEDEAAEETPDDNFDDEDYAPENAADDDLEEYDDEEEADDDEVEDEVQFREKIVQNHYKHKLEKIKETDEQIESSTISLGQNKSIKIKFKKETSSTVCNGSNGNNYSAYKIESIYQQEIHASPKTSTERRNGHNFHPYLLGQTSTPKTNNSFKRHKTKLKRVKQDNELSQNYCTNSNSSTVEREATNVVGRTAVPTVNDNAVQSANFNDNANYSFSSAVTFDNSNCSISSAVGRLNFKDNSALGLGASQLNVTNQSTLNASRAALEASTFQENSYFATQYDVNAKERRLNKALETIERHLAKEVIDPFNSELCRAFLTKLDFPQNAEEENYKIIQTPLPKIANTKVLNLAEGVNFNIDKEVGRGSYGSVYKATDANTGAVVALKYQKPPNTWEIYICDQVRRRKMNTL